MTQTATLPSDVELAEALLPICIAAGDAILAVRRAGHGVEWKEDNSPVTEADRAAEAIIIGERFGINPQTLVDVLNASTGRNNTTENKITQFMLSGKFNSGFALGLMVKDLALALEVAEDCGVPAELSHATLDVWQRAQETLQQGADHTEISKFADRKTS